MVNTIEQAAYWTANYAINAKNLEHRTDRGDIGTIVEKNIYGNKRIYSDVDSLCKFSYMPIISSLLGCSMIVRNVADLATNIFKMILLEQSPAKTKENIKRNILNIVKGVVVSVPFAGNAIIYAIDRIRIKNIENKINQSSFTDGQRYYYLNGTLLKSNAFEMGSTRYDGDLNYMPNDIRV